MSESDKIIIQRKPVYKTAYGRRISTESWVNYGHALLLIAGADGVVSKPELDWLTNWSNNLELPKSVVKRIMDFDIENGDLRVILGRITDVIDLDWERVLLYDAVRMARADRDYAIEEHAAVIGAAKLLRVPMDMAMAIDGLVAIEESIITTRLALFDAQSENASEGKIPTSTAGNPIIRIKPVTQQLYGLEAFTYKALLAYVKIIVYIVSADGKVSKRHEDWILNDFARFIGLPQEIRDICEELIASGDFADIDLSKELVKLQGPGTAPRTLRTLIYDATKAARADSKLSPAVKDRIAVVAKRVGVPQSITSVIDCLIESEKSVERLRQTLFKSETD